MRPDDHYALMFLEDEEDLPLSPERGLWSAITWRMLSDYIQGKGEIEGRKAELGTVAQEWLYSSWSPLEKVCAILGLDPVLVREVAGLMLPGELHRSINANERRQGTTR